MKTPPQKKDPLYILIAGLMVWIIVMMFIIILAFVSSSGVNGLEEGAETSEDSLLLSPVILSENPTNGILRLWSPSSTSTVVLYDDWEILVFGEVNETCRIKINDYEAFNGSLSHEVVNISFDASAISKATVLIEIGNRTYRWRDIVINHQGIDYGGPGSGSGSNLKFSESDISIARLKSAFGVVLASLFTIPFVWKGVRIWRNRQGVVQW